MSVNFIIKPTYDPATNRLRDPGTVRCSCGRPHELAWCSDSACDHCGTEFNAQGQQLAPRAQWEN